MNDLYNKYGNKIDELVRACHEITVKGLTSSSGGNLSLRADCECILITPTGMPKAEIRPEDICAVDLNGMPLFVPDGLAPTSETPFHTMIMRKRKDIAAVVHAHPTVLGGYAISKTRWLERPFFPEPAMEIGPIVTVPYAEPSCGKLAEVLAGYVDRSNGFLLQNHGALALSPKSVPDAVERLYMMESVAQSVFIALRLGDVRSLTYNEVSDLEALQKVRGLQSDTVPITSAYLFN